MSLQFNLYIDSNSRWFRWTFPLFPLCESETFSSSSFTLKYISSSSFIHLWFLWSLNYSSFSSLTFLPKTEDMSQLLNVFPVVHNSQVNIKMAFLWAQETYRCMKKRNWPIFSHLTKQVFGISYMLTADIFHSEKADLRWFNCTPFENSSYRAVCKISALNTHFHI